MNKYAPPALNTLVTLSRRSPLPSPPARRAPSAVFPAPLRRRFRGRRGVSDVIATILILALTVVLFGALFAFVSRFPAPPAQSVNQFQASVTHTSTAITGVSILQDGGPAVPTSDRVYLVSTRSTSDWQFSQANGIPVAWGLGNTSSGWATGQYWTTTFANSIKLPANITVYVVSNTQLLYSGVVPGGSPNVPPILTSTYTVPATPTVGEAFAVYAVVSGNVQNLTVNISLSEVPGLPTSVVAMVPSGVVGTWIYNVTAGLTSANGTYLGFIRGINNTGATIAGSIQVVLLSTGSGGSSSAPTAAVSISPNAPTVRANASLAASVTNPGSSSVTVSNITFYVNLTSSNHTNVKTLYPPKSTTLPTITAHSSAAVTSTVWMVPPSAQGNVSMVVVVKFSTGNPAVGASAIALAPAPYTGSVAEFSQNASITEKGGWNILVTVGNFGPLGDNVVNATVYVNKTGTTTGEGKVVSPANTTVTGQAYGYATYPTSSSLSLLGEYSTPTFVAGWRGGAMTSVMTLSVVVIVKITNAIWTTDGFSSTTVTLKLTESFSN